MDVLRHCEGVMQPDYLGTVSPRDCSGSPRDRQFLFYMNIARKIEFHGVLGNPAVYIICAG